MHSLIEHLLYAALNCAYRITSRQEWLTKTRRFTIYLETKSHIEGYENRQFSKWIPILHKITVHTHEMKNISISRKTKIKSRKKKESWSHENLQRDGFKNMRRELQKILDYITGSKSNYQKNAESKQIKTEAQMHIDHRCHPSIHLLAF